MSEKSHDIERYLRGELTPAEMHALEKQALDDPFLADALEGAAQFSQNDLNSDLQSLEKALRERTNEKKVVPLWTWTLRIAAAILVVAVATFIVINITDLSRKDDLAQVQEKREEVTEHQNATQDDLPSKPSDAVEAEQQVSSEHDNDHQAEEEKPLASPSKNQIARSNADATTPVSPPSPQEQVATLRSTEPRTDSLKTEQITLAEVAPAEVAKKPASGFIDYSAIDKEDASKRKANTIASDPASKDKSDAKELASTPARGTAYSISGNIRSDSSSVAVMKVTGRVTSADDGSGLPGVNVVIKGTSTGTVTDIHGNYQIEITDSYSTLVYSFIGLESMEMPVNNSPVVDARLQEDVAQLSEVVVTGFGEADSGPSFPTFQMAEPFGGRRAFKKYLEDKLIYPQQAIANNVEGKVTVQFVVEPTGKLSNFKVIKGIGYGCDEEVIRLIKQGPKWSATKRNDELVKSRIRVRMRFTLPKKK